MPQDQYQTVQEVADRLEVAEATVRQWIKSGVLRAIDIGKGWRVSDTDLGQFLRSRETAPRPSENRSSPPASKEFDDEPPR
jgi:excisionase family DNA binding protein